VFFERRRVFVVGVSGYAAPTRPTKSQTQFNNNGLSRETDS